MGTLQYFTPALYRRMQSDEFDQREWDAAIKGYAMHVTQLPRGAPSGVRVLARSSFHDCIVRGISVDLERATVVMELRGWWGVREKRAWRVVQGRHRIVFAGVQEVGAMRRGMRHWLYGEVHLLAHGKWEWRVMLGGVGIRVSTWTISFGEVSVASKKDHGGGVALRRR